MLRLNTKAAPVVVIALLIASHVWYSLEAAHVNAVLAGTLPLQKPLEELPYALGEWQGKDAPLSEAVVKVAAADHHVSQHSTEVIDVEPDFKSGTIEFKTFGNSDQNWL